ncbi:MAG TPA: DUF86 domain-containing protein [Thermoanaerobaculia bacterium]|nr:DUF86 domain-containing protein [Thermoanaerobaculia bacterium]
MEGYLTELRSFRDTTREEFVREPALHHLAERFLHLACECVLDIAHHLISDQGYRQATSYRSAIEILAEEHLLSEDLSARLQGWMGFRNVLVHFYMDIDHGKSYEAIQEDLGDLEEFGAVIARLLQP